MNNHKSYLRYTGSKYRLMDEIRKYIKSPTVLVEPFVGSGTVSINISANEYHWNDACAAVINTHRSVMKEAGLVIHNLEYIDRVLYKVLDNEQKYYQIRDDFNRDLSSRWTPMQSARFIYLNKRGFNGLIRFNRSGEFNVPVGRTPSGKERSLIEGIRGFQSDLSVRNISKFSAKHFADFMDEYIKRGDDLTGYTFYCDPPYVPVAAHDFNYVAEGFTAQEQHVLVSKAEQLCDLGGRVLISNHDTPFTRSLYRDADQIITLKTYRSVAAKQSSRGDVCELLAIYDHHNKGV